MAVNDGFKKYTNKRVLRFHDYNVGSFDTVVVLIETGWLVTHTVSAPDRASVHSISVPDEGHYDPSSFRMTPRQTEIT